MVTYNKSMDQPGKVANPARGQLNKENEYFPVSVRALEFGPARRVRQSHPASACSSPCYYKGNQHVVHLFACRTRKKVSYTVQ